MALEAGDLNRRITIQSGTSAKDPFGQPFIAWRDVCGTWAAIRTVTSKEVYALGAGFTSQVTHTITIRYRPDISSTMRIIYRDRTFLIQAVSDPDEGRVQLNLMCLEVNDGR